MRKIIWACWFQGRHNAPELVRKCLESWETRNPAWDFRCLDAHTIARYVDLTEHIDLRTQAITPASLSDIVRLLLLHEYGGVWVDATTYCNVPLDDWLALAAHTGFFAFARPSEDRELATWFLAAEPGNALLAKWAARAIAYWRGRTQTRDYFWVHHQFGELCAVDRDALRAWQGTPRIEAAGPDAIRNVGMYEDHEEAKSRIDWSVPVFKLTYRVELDRLGPNSLVTRLLGLTGDVDRIAPSDPPPRSRSAIPVGALRVGTENLGDHIQIIAGEALLRRAGLEPSFGVDRDDGIMDAPPAMKEAAVAILLNGWFKSNPSIWPPHPAYRPIYLGFHIRLFQSPSLVSDAALEHYAAHGPVGCRDRYTLSLLRSHGVDAFLSNCVSLLFPRRLPDPERQAEVFVVSRDRRILDYLPSSLGPFTFLSHYSGERDFTRNKARALELIDIYRTRAKLIVTTMLHCALPAIAMGIPVVVFYPPGEGSVHQSDKERFSSLSELVRVFHPSEASLADWRGYAPDVSALKLKLVDAFFAMAGRWGTVISPCIEASSASPPSLSDPFDHLDDPERLTRLAHARAADRQRWSARSSYKPEWAERGALASRHVRDGGRILEIGTGTGAFRRLVAGRCHYTGADLQPLDPNTLALDIEHDPIPPGPWDAIVLLGIVEYLHDPAAALAAIGREADTLILSYCLPVGPAPELDRRAHGWVNALSEQEIASAVGAAGLSLAVRDDCNAGAHFQQRLFVFARR